MIRFEKVSYTFPGRDAPAVNGVSFSLGEGERVCLAGANGSGKTTLALLLAGVLKPSEGRICIDERPVEKIPQGLAALGFQNPDDQMVASAVEKEIAFGLELQNRSMPEMEAEIAGITRRFQIESLKRRDISTLSGGEKQKVAIAALVVTSPRLLVLDEPDSFLDQRGKAALEEALRSLRQSHPQLIEVRITQEPESMSTAKRLIVMDRGEVVADDSSSKLLSNRKLMTDAGLFVTIESAESCGDNGVHKASRRPSAVVKIESLSFSYGDEMVIDSLSLEWHSGEIVGAVGDTGSGKSTLALLLCGLLKPTTGEIRCEGSQVEVGRLSITLAVQQPERQFFLPTCAEEIAFGPRNFGRQLSTSEIDEYLAAVGLEAGMFRDRDPLTLSVGEQRRLAFAVLEAMDCPFMIYDEPTAGLDARGITQFEAMARRLAGSGRGIMVISHDHTLIERLVAKKIALSKSKPSYQGRRPLRLPDPAGKRQT